MLSPRLRSAWHLCLIVAATLLLPVAAGAQAPERDGMRLAHLGSCILESGETIDGCTLGYRVYGRLEPRRSNAVLVTTWFTGRSDDWRQHLGADGWLDTTRFHVIVVDAFGNGVSSSPSNSRTQPGSRFPDFTIRDLVQAQHRLVTEQLRLRRLHAVVGISMGGMQALEWGMSHPDLVGRVVAVAGTPRPGPADRLIWSTALLLLENGRALMSDSALTDGLARLDVAAGAAFTRMPLDDYAAQLRAMLSHDVARRFQGDLRAAAQALRPRLLLIWSPDDIVVSSHAAAAFARDANAELLTVAASCGHLTVACDVVGERVREFLAR